MAVLLLLLLCLCLFVTATKLLHHFSEIFDFRGRGLENWVETQTRIHAHTENDRLSQLHIKLFSSVSMLNFLHCRYFTSCRRHCQQHQQWFSWLVQLDGRLHVFCAFICLCSSFLHIIPKLVSG